MALEVGHDKQQLEKTFQPILSRNQSKFFPYLHRLSSSFCAQLVKESARMRLHCVLADEELLGNLAIAHAIGNQREYFEFASGNTQLAKFSFIQCKRRGNRDVSKDDY